MRPKWVVYADNHRPLSRPWYVGETMAYSARQAANQIRHKRYPYSKSDELGFELIACIKGSQDELAFRAQAQNIPATFKSLPVIPSSLV
ncbi:MAG TPA: hypothetical protein DCZ84_03215 [Candidatus Vogelbacteria bacterium]|uniref:Uncharacterized protein n=1 Tax=Candidatus Vogelbacteria bacterium RIFOXYD1_FULL_51_18 TaxID=1802440 RepID=A0A1G2QHS8_9BACT|nr:MAG: hypothetical protein UY68_C0010G0002 [Parcubacteria group bacterium GW2011_GWF2_52_12]KKW33872.1 MAG: hypothetical protein UY80_C0030G0002 [Parcubacteria group bacterium GW2011_GWB1_53_43]OHA60017.1 MAG: hypothetical protein A2569_01705 [Candidatus Vogelbacteria bacterium RIFOXYD1_FULL_51_18]HBB65614.1 hypothetical protein [Candidatus Vogelbacteria bacterium]HBC43967.1 hypothetical protein [Candidatus Vogelbacteria bacterium]